MAEHAYDEFDLAASRPGAGIRSFGSPVRSDATPANWDDLERYPEYDFGPLRVRVPADAQLRMADPDSLYSDAAFFVFPDGKVRLSVLAAPRGGRLWPERAEEIAAMQANLGADIRQHTGEWGQELQITDDGETNWVIGVDGPRWMLLGRSTSPVGADAYLAETMRDMIRSSVVFRGDEPLPVRTPLPLREPGTFEADEEREDRTETPYSGVVTLILPKVQAPVAEDAIDRRAREESASRAAAPVANPDWAIAARAASPPAAAGRAESEPAAVWTEPAAVWSEPVPAVEDSRHALRSVPVAPAPEPPLARTDDDRQATSRQVAANTATGAPRGRGGLLAAAALVVIVGLAGLVFALRGSTPGPAVPSIAAPQQVNEKLTPNESYPDDAYATTPKAPKIVPQAPTPKAAPPLAAGPAIKGVAPVPGVPGAKPVTPRVTTPVRSSPAQANAAARALPNSSSAVHQPASGSSRSSLAPATPTRSGPSDPQRAASNDYPDDKPRKARSKSGHNYGGDEDEGPIGALSDDVLGAVPGLG